MATGSANSASRPPWTATSSCASGLAAGRSAAGRWRAPMGSGGCWPSGWSATASEWWTCRPSWPPGCGCCSVGHGRKSDPHDAVSVAVAARNVPSLRQVRVEDQAVVLHLLTKRRQDLVAARTQTINRLHRLLMDLVPGGARRNLTASGPPRCWPRSRRPARRRSPATSWPLTWSPTCVAWSSGSPARWRTRSSPGVVPRFYQG